MPGISANSNRHIRHLYNYGACVVIGIIPDRLISGPRFPCDPRGRRFDPPSSRISGGYQT
eukprot:7421499-Pyramimonas_sp.AAC.1